MSSSISSNVDLNRAKRRIAEAISIGAPAYNAGDIKRCADVYGDTARDIAPLLPSVLQIKLNCAVSAKETGDTDDYDARAWAIRRIFDSIVDYQPPLVPEKVSSDVTVEPFTAAQLGGEPVGVMDSVMGGVSQGGWIARSNTFFGETSLANNGGFASLRWRLPAIKDWSYAKGIYIKGLQHSNPQEHTFKLILKDALCQQVRIANYKAIFSNPEGVDEPLLIPFTVFDQMEQMGNAMVGSPAINSLAITEIGIMAIKPTVVGEFQLEFSEWGLYIEK